MEVNKGPSSQGYGFSSSHVWMWQLDYKESWVLKNWCFWAVVLEKILESPLDCKEIQPVHLKGSQSWIFIGRIDAEAETPILWPSDLKNQCIGKDPDAGKDWSQEEKGNTRKRWLDGIAHHLILCSPLLFLLSIFPSIRVFSNASVLLIRWPKYWSFSVSLSNKYLGLISFRIDWLDLLAVQRTLKSLLQHHSSTVSILWCSAFFMV